MAAPLSILISDPNGCLTFQIFGLTLVSGQAPQKPGMKSCGVCALGCSAFRGSDRFTVTRSVQKGRGISLSRRDLPVISALVSIRQMNKKLLKQREWRLRWAEKTETGFTLPGHQQAAAEASNGKPGKLLQFRKLG